VSTLKRGRFASVRGHRGVVHGDTGEGAEPTAVTFGSIVRAIWVNKGPPWFHPGSPRCGCTRFRRGLLYDLLSGVRGLVAPGRGGGWSHQGGSAWQGRLQGGAIVVGGGRSQEPADLRTNGDGGNSGCCVCAQVNKPGGKEIQKHGVPSGGSDSPPS